jgi:hypothetical protein
MVPSYKTGTYTGSGATQAITLGFKPEFVLGFNQTDGDGFWFHINGMTAATVASVDSEVGAETNGCTLTPTGFSLGSDAEANESAKVYIYFAFGNANLDASGA